MRGLQEVFFGSALFFHLASSTEVYDDGGFLTGASKEDMKEGLVETKQAMPIAMPLNMLMQEHENDSRDTSASWPPNQWKRRRRLLEYDPNSPPENNIHSIEFHGYNNTMVKPWMVEFLSRINEIRLDEGISNPLCFNEILMRAAQLHMDDMIENDETIMISHRGSDGMNSGERITREGYKYTCYGSTIFAQTDCLSLECALSNRPVFFTERGMYNQFGIAKEDGSPPRGPRWYYIFAASDEDMCMGLDVNMIDWLAGTPTNAPVEEKYLPPPVPGDGAELVEEWMIGLLSLLNAERAHANTPDFCFNKNLMITADGHTQDMVDNHYYGHQSLNGTGPGARATEQGYNLFSFMAENLVIHEADYRGAMFAWMASKKGHGYNIINPEAFQIGVARNEELGLYTLVMGNYQTAAEGCIDSIACESMISYVSDDPLFNKYACSYCRHRTELYEYGNMGCGFGIKWYKTGDLEFKMKLYFSLDGIDSLAGLLGNEVADFVKTIKDPVFGVLDKTLKKGNVTVEVVEIGGVPISDFPAGLQGSSQRLLQTNNNTNSTNAPLIVVIEITITMTCMFYSECHSQHFLDDIEDKGQTALQEEVNSGNLTSCIQEEASNNNCVVLSSAVIDPSSLQVVQIGAQVEEDEEEFEMTHFPTSSPTSSPTVPISIETCNDAVQVSFQTLTGNTVGKPTTDVEACGLDFATYPGVWYKIIGTGNTMHANLCGSANSYDTWIGLYTGSCSNIVCLASNDDHCGPAGTGSYVTWSSNLGEAYFIFVTGFGGATGNYELVLYET